MMKRTIVLITVLAGASAARADVNGTVNVIKNDAAYKSKTQLTPSASDYATARGVLPLVRSLPPSGFKNNAPPSDLSNGAGDDGHAPLVPYTNSPVQLFDPSTLAPAPSNLATQPIPAAVGTGRIQFTTSRVFPAAADTAYPYSATGKLWFTINGSWFVCSGSMVKPGVVATAGQCVHSGNGSLTGWYSNFQFVPAFRNGSAPFGVWTSWVLSGTTGAWYNGGGTVPNDADYALIVFNRNASGFRIGDYTGWLGWQFPAMIGRHITVFGYPVNLDSGLINHRIDSQVYQGSGNTGVFGSDMRGGSGGGGVVFNFGIPSVGTPTGPEFNSNRLASVVSYLYTDPNVLVEGGSQFDIRFQQLLDAVCGSASWAC